MARNDEPAAGVRARLAAGGVVALNLMSSPESGKTTLLGRTLAVPGEPLDIACNLDARQVTDALDHIDLDKTRLLIIENIGNLVCPASWDLGENARVVLFAVTEGEDKPSTYPRMFEKADWVVITKTDLLPHVPFDVERAVRNCLQVNPRLQFVHVSALTGHGLEAWFDLLRHSIKPLAAV